MKSSTFYLAAILLICCSVIVLIACNKDETNDEPAPVYFPVLEVSGSHYDIGFEIGKTFKSQIETTFARTTELFSYVEQLIAVDTITFYHSFLDATMETYPQYIEELEGMAEGSGISFRKLFILSTMSEYIALLESSNYGHFLGCSTIIYHKDGSLIFAHNEDGLYDFADIMYIVIAHPDGKPSFVNFCYPGIVIGVGPAFNDVGIFFSGNFITGKEIIPGGVPITFIWRSMMESESLDEAIEKATISNPTYAYNINLYSRADQKAVHIEAAPGYSAQETIDGFYVHTNHFLIESMDTLCILDPSTTSRYEVLTGLTAEYESKPDQINPELVQSFLASHQNEPLSPCTHGTPGEVSGQTLGSILFNVDNNSFRVAFNNPCKQKFQTITLN